VTRIRGIVLGVAVVVISLGLVFVAAIRRPQVSSHGSLLGKRAPVVAMTNLLDGKSVSTTARAGQVLVVNFWNSWCIPCRQEQDALKQFYAEHRTDPAFTMVGVLRDDSTKAAATYAVANKMNWTLAADPNGKAAVAFGTTGQPETYVIGADGVVAAALYGPASVTDLDNMLSRAQVGS
jgi:cytochrome c biogenesis protein CcmG/thiol:disulfide interchange protein DsbE